MSVVFIHWFVITAFGFLCQDYLSGWLLPRNKEFDLLVHILMCHSPSWLYPFPLLPIGSLLPLLVILLPLLVNLLPLLVNLLPLLVNLLPLLVILLPLLVNLLHLLVIVLPLLVNLLPLLVNLLCLSYIPIYAVLPSRLRSSLFVLSHCFTTSACFGCRPSVCTK